MRRVAWAVVMTIALLAAPAGAAASGRWRAVEVMPAPRIPGGAKRLGPVASRATVSGAVVLRPRDARALERFIAAVSTPGSASFRRYLKPGKFATWFGPARSTIAAVVAQLSADRLTVTDVARDGLFVSFTGRAADVERDFHTDLERYRLADGSNGQGSTSALRMPPGLASSVLAIVGVDNFVRPRPASLERGAADDRGRYRAARATSFAHPSESPSPCPAATAFAERAGGLTDDQIAHSYGAFGLYGVGDLGAGQRIGVLEQEPFLQSDIETFDSCYFGTDGATRMMRRLHVIPIDGGLPQGYSPVGEANLDIDDVSALAPEARIDVYEDGYPNLTDTDADLDEYMRIVNDDSDQVITQSYLDCEQFMQSVEPGMEQAEDLLFEQAAAQGQSIFVAAGDDGSDNCGNPFSTSPTSGQNPLSTGDPASQPDVVAVGGTTIEDATQPPQERAWSDVPLYAYGGGGGISTAWAMPSWQLDAKVPGIVLPGSAAYTQADQVEQKFGYPQNFCQSYLADAGPSTPCRTIPDVSADADPLTGAVTYYEASYGGWNAGGGTSSATPIWAALLADVNASPACRANPRTAQGVGFVNPLLYAAASNPVAYSASFNDITAGNNDIYDLDNGEVFPATTGYDLATGLGSPELTGPGGSPGLAFYLCNYATRPTRPVVENLTPALLPTAGGAITIHGTRFTTGRTPDVADIQVGSRRLPSSDFSVNSNTSITVHVPPATDGLPLAAPQPLDGAGPADVIVTLTDGESSAPAPASTLQYVDEAGTSPVPAVSAIRPAGGSQTRPTPVTILGSGFTGATRVQFGGVTVSRFTVVSPYEIKVTPPAYSRSTQCAPNLPDQTPLTDVCQAQVRVENAHGTSAEAKIVPPLEGTIPLLHLVYSGLPPGCQCEIHAAPTEFDYTPTPKITSISTSPADPSSLASEQGGTVITVTGRGLDFQTTWGPLFGDPSLYSSGYNDPIFETGTEMQLIVPPEPLSTEPESVPFYVESLAGFSAPGPSVTYAGIPVVSSALNTATGRDGAPDTGGTPIVVSGNGLAQATGPLQFTDSQSSYSTTTQSSYTINSDTSISSQTVQQDPALVDVEVCSVTGCSSNPPADYLALYPPGDPKVDSITPTSGTAAGGTPVTIGGENLSCVTGVYFGGVAAEQLTTAQALANCGQTNFIDPTAPPGHAGTTIPVTVATVESDYTGSGPSKSSASFTYTP